MNTLREAKGAEAKKGRVAWGQRVELFELFPVLQRLPTLMCLFCWIVCVSQFGFYEGML